jgi:hypothetical protein
MSTPHASILIGHLEPSGLTQRPSVDTVDRKELLDMVEPVPAGCPKPVVEVRDVSKGLVEWADVADKAVAEEDRWLHQ